MRKTPKSTSRKKPKSKVKHQRFQPDVKKLRTIKFEKRFYACHELHELLGIPRGTVASYCTEGLVPHCRRLSNDWIITRQGAMFLARWFSHRRELGTLWKRTVKTAAGKADPACVVRQQEHAKRSESAASDGDTDKPKELELEDVLEIRRRVKAGELLEDIARDYGMDQSAIYYIGDFRSYANLPNSIKLPE